ncbi:uncharacterized protein LOC132162193 [Corylus avellana]|uniref:uncharacterized protein LOC132162193 n=1 Tax=Corylus avellana TaxID=13451 RepID=UPI00286B1471|nr:uncharacterized protein LOC132162193 [Corylus avellana]
MEMQLFLRERLKRINFSHGRDWHPLTFVEELKIDGKEQVVCTKCNESAVVGPTFKCNACPYLRHVSCYDKSTFKFHFGRRHDNDQLMFTEELKNDDGKEGVVCMACDEQVKGPGYKCSTSECNFRLHKSCAQLPRQIQCHPSHPNHILILRHPRIASSICNACEILKHEGHQHSLSLPISSNKNCNACDHSHTYSKNTQVFVCTTCDFALGFECATLPLVARHKNDEHPLALTYAAENNSGEYYCQICEKERDSNHWFYYCVKYDFPAHLQCVLGKYPYIKFGRSYKSEDHQHSVTFVRKTKDSPPCDACGKTFNGMAIECNQCMFNVHYWEDECLLKYK